MRTLMLAAALATLSAVQVLAGPPLDADGDGKVTLAEFKAARTALIMGGDANGDGRIEPSELGFVSKAQTTLALSNPEDGKRVFAALDKNADGALTRAEIDEIVERRFNMLDSDKNGYLSQGELKAWNVAQ